MRHDDDQFDLFGARSERDLGMDRARQAARDWYDQAVLWAMKLSADQADWTGTGEDLRIMVYGVIGPPRTNSKAPNNVWGAVVGELVKREYLVPTGRRTQMRTRRSHGRKTDIYRVNR